MRSDEGTKVPVESCAGCDRLVNMPEPITVFLMDDHEVVRQGVRALLEASGEIRVVGEASTAAEALARIPAVRPDVAVLDVRVPDGNGIEVCREIRSRLGTACLMLTSYSDDEALFEAIMAGAAGYVLKQIRGSELLSAVKRVGAGESLLDPAITGRVLQRLRTPSETDERLARLSEQERRILALIAEGLTNRQIAAEMNLAEKTIKNYVSNLLSKLGMERRTEAAVFATKLELSGQHIQHD
jgi:two-component system, NarL family, response regulator DevR